MQDLLLEIGVEEMPARLAPQLLAELKRQAAERLDQARLTYQEIQVYGAPRRLALLVTGLAEEQKEAVEEVKGPPQKAAFEPGGEPTKAALGFARSQQVDVKELVVRELPSGSYVFARKVWAGQKTETILPSLVHELILGLNVAHPMRWGDHDLKFIRPIRWLVALYGEDVVPVTIGGLSASNQSRGHRVLHPGPVNLTLPRLYVEEMHKAGVLVDPDERRRLIWEQVQELARDQGGRVEPDASLLEEVNFLAEHPTALVGSFDEEFLELPPEVLTTPMRDHQRYFPIWQQDGARLLPRFVAVRDGGRDFLEVVRRGNEKVLRARLADARFFFQEDLASPLGSQVEALQGVVFQEGLGNMYQKTQRLGRLVEYLGRVLPATAEEVAVAQRAAYLAKADLLTQMVYEFPELQGIMGDYYARAAGESPAVGTAIREHLWPRSADDVLPTTWPGAILSLADKMDSLVGFLALGLSPSGSQDPYALRRQGLGLCRILVSRDLHLSLKDLIQETYHLYADVAFKLDRQQAVSEVTGFLRQRLEGMMESQGINYDLVDAVMAPGCDDVAATWARAQALAGFRSDPRFEALLTAYSRAANLARQARHDYVRPELLAEPVEQELWEKFQAVRAEADTKLRQRDYLGFFISLSGLKPYIDAFFDGVLVMAEDEAIRANRLALLRRVAGYIGQVADLSRIVVA